MSEKLNLEEERKMRAKALWETVLFPETTSDGDKALAALIADVDGNPEYKKLIKDLNDAKAASDEALEAVKRKAENPSEGDWFKSFADMVTGPGRAESRAKEAIVFKRMEDIMNGKA